MPARACLHIVELIAASVVPATTLVVAIVDRRRHPGRDWLHWTGVGLFVFFAAGHFILTLRWLA